MTEESQSSGNPLIILGDKIAPKPHLTAFVKDLKLENSLLEPGEQVKYAICGDSGEVATTLKKYQDDVKIVDPRVNPLGDDPTAYAQVQANLEELKVIFSLAKDADRAFFQPLIKEHVVSGMAAGADIESMSPEERAKAIDKRLDAVNAFPSLPDTQRKVAALDDLDPPKKWAEAIDDDIPTKTVILRILNSARYGFRSRVETIDQAVALASARTIREIVAASQIRQIFSKTSEGTIDQFWRHSLAVAYFAKLLSLPADPAVQDSQQKTEFERYQLEEDVVAVLQEMKLWEKFELGEADDPFTSGLLHDIGKVTMLMCLEDSLELVMALIEEEFQEAQGDSKMWAHQVVAIERFLMKDLDHQVIGTRLADKWEVDASVQQAISNHHNIGEHAPSIVKLTAMADIAGNCLFPYPATDTQHPFPILFERIDQALKKAPKQGPEAIEQIISEEIFEDLLDVLNRLELPNHLWELIDFKSFFKLVYVLAPKIKSATIGFMQQTA